MDKERNVEFEVFLREKKGNGVYLVFQVGTRANGRHSPYEVFEVGFEAEAPKPLNVGPP